MRFAKLKDVEGANVLVNPNAVASISEAGDGDGDSTTCIVSLLTGGKIYVAMGADAVGRTLVNAEK